MEQSGTLTASSISGFKLGTRSMALVEEMTSAGMPASSQPRRNISRKRLESPGSRTNSPPVCSTHFSPILLRIRFSL